MEYSIKVLAGDDRSGDNWSYTWDGKRLKVSHELGKVYLFQLLDVRHSIVIVPAVAELNSLELVFPRPLTWDEAFDLRLIQPDLAITDGGFISASVTSGVDSSGDGWTASWDEGSLKINHNLGTPIFFTLTTTHGKILACPANLSDDELVLTLPDDLDETKSFEVRMFKIDPDSTEIFQVTLGQDYYGKTAKCIWNDDTLLIEHELGTSLLFGVLDAEGNTVVLPSVLEYNRLTLTFGEGTEADTDEEYTLWLCSAGKLIKDGSTNSSTGDDSSEDQFRHYSGPKQNILDFCKALGYSEDRLSAVRPYKIEQFQELADRAIDGYLTEFYFTPLRPYNQVQLDGTTKKVFPGKLRLLAIQWTSGLLLQSEFQNVESNSSEQARTLIEDAMKQMQQMTDFGVRIPGQKRKNPLPTMPPNLAPSRTMEYFM